MQTNDYIYFSESDIYEIKNLEDLDFLLKFTDGKQKLVEKVGDKYRINFVGEVITPSGIYFSLPKNMEESEDNVLLIKKVLVKYAKDEKGKSLVINRSGSYTSERAYFDKLKEYFLDFITYEFIYPLKRKKIHSNSPIDGGRISIIDTVKNRRRFGGGVTYKTKDVLNDDTWMLDDIYYFTIKELENNLGVSQYERKQIEQMTNYLISEGYSFNNVVDNKIYSKSTKKEILDLSNSKEVVDKIKKCEVGIIHNPIKNILLEYYSNKQKAASKSSVNVIFTSNFEKVWELIIQDAIEGTIKDNCLDFRESKINGKYLKDKFNKVETTEKFVPSEMVKELSKEYPILNKGDVPTGNKWMENRNNRYFACKKYRFLIPDLFVELPDGRRFLGDAKYYKDVENSNFDKELYVYNEAQENIYPMVIFAIPDTANFKVTIVPPGGYRRSDDKELIIITVCVEDVINDAIDKTNKVLDKSIQLVEKYTRRWETFDNISN